MAKTFNPNRVGGGSVSIVRAADGTYSLKETDFDQISSLNMIDLGAVATTTTAAKTETAAEKTGTTTADQTKAAFLLPSGDKEDPFTFEKTLKSGADVSKSLQTTFDKPVSTFDAMQEDSLENRTSIKSPTENVFGRSIPSEEQFQRQDMLPETKVETPQEKLAVTSANVQSGKVDPPGFTNPFKGLLGRKFQTEKGSEVTQAGQNINFDRIAAQDQAAKIATQGMGVDPTKMIPQMGSLGISPTVGSFGQDPTSQVGGTDLEADSGTIPRADIQPAAKKTFVQSVGTALKGVGEAVSKLPTIQLITGLGRQRNEDQATIGLNSRKFNIVTSPGPMQGRIVGDRGEYDPANNLFHGMNRASALGNLESAGKKRIDRINRTIEKKKARGQDTSVLEKRSNDFQNELKDYQREKAAEQKATQGPAGGQSSGGNYNGGGNNNSGKSIVCTAMYQTTGLQDWSKAMKIWYIYQKKYLTIQHQEGYHKLFRPFVKAMHKNNIVKEIGAHFAKHRTQHLKHVMFNSKPSLLGKIYNKILEPICYWAGKK